MNITIYQNIKQETLGKLNIFTLNLVKSYLKIDDDNDDELLIELINAAVEYAENFVNIQINPVRVSLEYTNIFKDNIVLPHSQILNIENVAIETYGEFKSLEPKYYKLIGKTVSFKFPIYTEKMQITYTTGFRSDQHIPHLLKQGILAHIKAMYYHEPNGLDKVHNYYIPFIQFKL